MMAIIRWFVPALLACSAPVMAKVAVVGQPAPDANMTTVKSQNLKLSELRGQVVVINFWATWCVPCRAELPLLDKYYRVQEKHGLRIFAATTEDSIPEQQLRRLFDVLAITPLRRLRGPYEPIDGAVPTNFIIDRAGKLRYAKAGAFSLDDLNRELVPLLQEPAPPLLQTVQSPPK